MAAPSASDLEAILAECRSVFPEIAIAVDRLAARAESRNLDRESLTRMMASSTLPDLVLAWDALEGNAKTVERVLSLCERTVDASLRRIRLSADQRAEVGQQLRDRLFLADGDRPALLENFSGRGRLVSWVGIVAARAGMKLMGANPNEVLLANDVVDHLLEPEADPELEHMKEVYREEFRAAFHKAMAELDRKQRLVLRQRYLDGVSVNDLCRIHKAHRSTISLWLSEGRAALAERTRAHLAAQLGLSLGECESVLRLVESKLEVTMSLMHDS